MYFLLAESFDIKLGYLKFVVMDNILDFNACMISNFVPIVEFYQGKEIDLHALKKISTEYAEAKKLAISGILLF